MIAKTIGKEQAQQDHRAFYHASLQKSAGFPCAALKKRRATKPFNEIFPVLIQKRFVSHPTLNHKSIPTSKNILTPMRLRGDDTECVQAKIIIKKTTIKSYYVA
jgi:hypothetical protein